AKPPRLDAESVRVTDDGRVQIVDWGARLDTPGTLDDEVTVVAPLLALAATGSASGQTNRAVPAPLMRVVERTLAGQYASVDAVENELRRTATTANAPTAAIPRARPTVIIPDRPAQPQTGPPAPYPAPRWRPRRSLLLPGAGLLVLVGLLVGGSLLRNRLPAAGTAANTTVDATPSVVAPASNAATTTSPGQGRPYVVAARGARTLVVRSGPGTGSARIGALPNGTPVRVVGEPVAADGYRWVQIESDTLNGWCILEGLRQR
ncbi:MAG: SH3 domain-containing protein, partial [Chloroflexota bacterium]|nr:SH3 domain-containing protein [Chloroflexota bacterium]